MIKQFDVHNLAILDGNEVSKSHKQLGNSTILKPACTSDDAWFFFFPCIVIVLLSLTNV